jgi:hypothetical protein
MFLVMSLGDFGILAIHCTLPVVDFLHERVNQIHHIH